MALGLTKLSETATKITLGWTPVVGAVGYRFQSAVTEPKWSHTWDPARSQVTFSKADWYRVEALGSEALGEYPQPVPALWFAEAALRPGYATLKGAGSFGSYPSNPVNGGEDCLLDLEGTTRTGTTTVWTKQGQRIQIRTGRWNGVNQKGGLRVRSVDGIGAEHVSATDMRAINCIDAFVVSGNPGSPATTYTLQKVRTEYPSYNINDGGEHCDAVQVQGDLKRLEIGMSTFWLAGVLSGGGSSGHPGKGLMLNTISKLAFEVELNRVNYRAADLLTGAAIFKDYSAISMETTEVYFDKQGSSGNQWGTSGAFFPTAQFAGDVASWAAQHNWQGIVRRGLPPDGDFCP